MLQWHYPSFLSRESQRTDLTGAGHAKPSKTVAHYMHLWIYTTAVVLRSFLHHRSAAPIGKHQI